MSREELKYFHKHVEGSLNKDFVEQREENIVEDKKGIKIKLFVVKKDKRKKVTIFGKNGTFNMRSDIDGAKEEKDLSKDDLMKLVKKDNDFSFLEAFLKTVKGGMWLEGGAKKRKSKKGSKKRGSKKRGSKK